jgi:hypothetical protein
MNIYKPIIIVGIIVASVIVGLAMYDQLTAATRDKRSECRDVIDFTHPQSGYSYEEWQNLQQSIHNTFGNNEQ